MLRKLLGTIIVAVVLALGVPGPAPAVERYDPLAGLTVHPEWGSVTGHSGVLRRSCRTYTFHYAIDPPEGTWALEVFIQGPRLNHLGGGAYLDGYDPKVGSGRYKLCRNSTHYGTFRISAKLSVDDGYGNITEGRLPIDKFRLRKPRR